MRQVGRERGREKERGFVAGNFILCSGGWGVKIWFLLLLFISL